ncbi:hypothetical protein [Bradyrhizobium cosmicum]|uniref:hypothetical protein n=1 Tax=Bradyrhizobium cosmicum TaxID=1404864 RepID=UPI0028E3DCEC|nr:hypothetical protein [Bradyrhizobium cosmicum]
MFCPTGQRHGGSECRLGATRKSLIDQRAFYCAWGCFRSFCFGAKKKILSGASFRLQDFRDRSDGAGLAADIARRPALADRGRIT